MKIKSNKSIISQVGIQQICLVDVVIKPHPKDKIWGDTKRTIKSIVYLKRIVEINKDTKLRYRIRRRLNTTKDDFQIYLIKLIKVINT